MHRPSYRSDELPTPPPGSWWEVHGETSEPWLISELVHWEYDCNMVATSMHLLVTATAGQAYATLHHEAS